MTQGPFYFSERDRKRAPNVPMPVSTVLLVEGSSDAALFSALAQKLNKLDVQIYDMNGKQSGWPGALQLALAGEAGAAVQSVGLVVDADDDYAVSFSLAQSYLNATGLNSPADTSSQALTVVTPANQHVKSSIFVVSPDGLSGNLDHILNAYFDDVLDKSCLDAYEHCSKTKLSVELSLKSRVQIRLATRPKPIPSPAQGIRKEVIDVEHNLFASSKVWLDMTIP